MKLLHNTKIEFQKGRILSAEMLELLQRKILQNWKPLENAPDGIISGLHLEMREGKLWLTKGLVKLADLVYELSEDIAIDTLPKDFSSSDCTLAITQADPERTGQSVVTESAELQWIKYGTEVTVPHIIIGTAHRPDGTTVKLHSVITDDPKTHLRNMLFPEDGFFSFPYCNYIINSNLTFHPLVFSWIRQSLENKRNKTIMEYTLLMLLYQSPVVAVDVLRTYVKRYADNPDDPALQQLEGADLLLHVIQTIENAEEIFAHVQAPKNEDTKKTESRIIF